tara:strand:+ start:250 stop:438 length:189 start_codon:yes stop_codon:yes gene_type:complete
MPKGNIHKKLRNKRITMVVDNISAGQLHALRLELRIISRPWEKQGVKIRQLGKASGQEKLVV